MDSAGFAEYLMSEACGQRCDGLCMNARDRWPYQTDRIISNLIIRPARAEGGGGDPRCAALPCALPASNER
jgi:hypothetical protein